MVHGRATVRAPYWLSRTGTITYERTEGRRERCHRKERTAVDETPGVYAQKESEGCRMILCHEGLLLLYRILSLRAEHRTAHGSARCRDTGSLERRGFREVIR